VKHYLSKKLFFTGTNKFLSHLLISLSLFLLRALLTFVLGDLYKFNETILFFSLYFFLLVISFKLNSDITFRGSEGSFFIFIFTNTIFSILEFLIFQLLFVFFEMQYLRIVFISPVSVFLKFYMNKKYSFK